jgi:transposase, IS30 family
MSQCYKHLSHSERTLIYWWLKDNLSIREMGRRMNRSHSTISRELKRNLWFSNPNYSPRGAQQKYEWRLQRRATRYRLKEPCIRRYVIDRLQAGWTPEIISGRLKRVSCEKYVCHESIYQFIYKEAPELYVYLPRQHQKRRIKQPYRSKPSRIKNSVSVHARPKNANERIQLGHWESDSIVSVCRQLGLNVLVERKTRLSHISLMKVKTADTNHHVITTRLKKYLPKMIRSITYDNGSENTLHEKTNKTLKTKSYFCEPYHSWEKGSVEQVNGLIRRFIPKGTDFKEISVAFINKIEKLLNNRPRKCLNYQTPYEAFRKESGALPC